MSVAFKDEFTVECILRMKENKERIGKCLRELSEAEVWQRPNSQLVSIANLVLHLCGNIRQYVISSLGGIEDGRQRSLEFSAADGYTKLELLKKLESTLDEAVAIINNAGEDELLRVRNVQGFDMSGIGIIVHVTEHLSYHTGQIALHTKLIREKDLGFYAGMNLDVNNQI